MTVTLKDCERMFANIEDLPQFIAACRNTLQRMKAGERAANTKIKRLKEQVKDAYEEGWNTGRNTTAVDGDPTHDWNKSSAKKALGVKV